jgi:hypothetical protein
MYTRRGFIGIAAASALYGSNSEFWNKKDPSQWSSNEVDQLTTKSPWAKEVSISAPADRGDYGQQQPTQRRTTPSIGIPGIGGIGGMGGGGGRGRMPQGGNGVQTFKGTIRWESAQPILDALRSKIPASFENHYVISVSGIPITGRYNRSEDDPDVERLKGVTYLAPQGKRDLQPGIVQQQSSSYGSVLFGFSKELLKLGVEDKEVQFTTQFGRLNIKARFVLKDMLYHGELAV